MSADADSPDTTGRPEAALYATAAVPAHRRPVYWRDALARTFSAPDVSLPGEDCSGTIRTSWLGPVRVATVEGGPVAIGRPAQPAGTRLGEALVVMSPAEGEASVEQDGREARVRPGETVFCDMTRPIRIGFTSAFHVKALVLPQRLLGLTELGLRRLTTTPMSPDTPYGALLGPVLTKLADTAPTLSRGTGEALARHVVDLLSVLAEERLNQDGGDPPGAAAHLLPRIQAFIERQLGDPDLAPESIARAHGISVRYLHRLFEHEDTTVRRWIQRRRLQECRRELARRGSAGLTISGVARRWGFTSAAHFSRAFRTMYGMSPAEWRAFRVPDASTPAPVGVAVGCQAATELRPRRPISGDTAA
ncbi:helix-turn-helix domain-containing protein [Streptomyces pseudoechinosporeus]